MIAEPLINSAEESRLANSPLNNLQKQYHFTHIQNPHELLSNHSLTKLIQQSEKKTGSGATGYEQTP